LIAQHLIEYQKQLEQVEKQAIALQGAMQALERLQMALTKKETNESDPRSNAPERSRRQDDRDR